MLIAHLMHREMDDEPEAPLLQSVSHDEAGMVNDVLKVFGGEKEAATEKKPCCGPGLSDGVPRDGSRSARPTGVPTRGCRMRMRPKVRAECGDRLAWFGRVGSLPGGFPIWAGAAWRYIPIPLMDATRK